jgi:triphosphoribosyl-dephospho-CoA synthase
MGADLNRRLQEAYIDACDLELRAFKPGNVSVYADGHDMTVEDFRRSARISAPHVADASLRLGERIFRAVQATRAAVGCNTNLGIVLLCAPLLQAYQTPAAPDTSLRMRLRSVLEAATVTDAEWVYRAIRLAGPAGLGEVPEQDVRSAPKVSLGEAMRLASHRDRIAGQYVSCYADIFDFTIPLYHNALSRWGNPEWAAVAVYVGLLKRMPDSHITRKFGDRYTGMVMTRMALLDEELARSPGSKPPMRVLKAVDAEFKAAGINPGTTADLTVTCLLAVHLEAMHRGHGNDLQAARETERLP